MTQMISRTAKSLEQVGQYFFFALRVLALLPSAFRRPTDLVQQCERIGIGSLPLVAAAGMSIGVVSWLQTRTLLANYGSESQLPGLVAVFVVIGLGPVLTALVVAGQVGARLGAELGSMSITEQVDALNAMGLSATRHLAACRVLACVLMLPLLTIVMCYLAILAACAAEMIGGSLSLQQYTVNTLKYLKLKEVLAANGSSLLFGFIIGTTASWFGLRADHGTEGVGRASTYSVIGSMFLILLANVLWVRMTDLLLH